MNESSEALLYAIVHTTAARSGPTFAGGGPTPLSAGAELGTENGVQAGTAGASTRSRRRQLCLERPAEDEQPARIALF